MSKISSHLSKLFFFVFFIKTIIWALLVPLWHFPDEQAHFGHVAFIAEGGDLKWHGQRPDLNEEIYISEEILGTNRDYQGNNKFTFHPEYRLDYSGMINGLREQEIKELPLTTRKNFVFQESAYYPHFFYQISSLIYKLFYLSNLFIRVFSLRLFWLSAYLLMIYLVFKTAQLIFPKDPLINTTITLLTGFHPMLSFTSAGVTSDNLHNLLFTAAIYFGLKIITNFNQPKPQDFIGLTLVLGLGMINKQQFFVAIIMIIPSLLFVLLKNPKKVFRYFLFLPLALLIAYLLAPARIGNIFSLITQGKIPYLELKNPASQIRPDYRLFQHLMPTLRHTIREVLPWYWGVFNWLGVVLPRWVNRVLMRLLALAGLGLLVKLFKIIKSKKFTRQDLSLSFIAWAAVIYFAALMVWDWIFFKNNGYSFGLQGRYYFPVIATHMILLVVGVKQVFQFFGKKISHYSLLALSLWFIVLNFIALHTVAKSYYDLTSFKTFIIQASQYKPWFAKGMWFSSLLIIYFVVCFAFIFQLIKFFKNHEK
ncbi:hypothetical protein ACFL18_00110 [Patescibacteria group bacterium]